MPQISKSAATFGVFFVSALLHEVLFSVAFRTVRPWFFIGMLIQVPAGDTPAACCEQRSLRSGGRVLLTRVRRCLRARQVPLIVLSRHFRGTRRGNVLMWTSLFCGQPLLEVRAAPTACVDPSSLAARSLTETRHNAQILYFREYFQKHTKFFCVE